VVCEDGAGDNYLVGIKPDGSSYKIARNATGETELAGVCFSPVGDILFVNIQAPGLTVAVTGPWQG
jgi:secreted PhoX family phosphatase